MQPLRATVRNGRLVLDEPTTLPEGEVVYLQPANAVLSPDDDAFDEEERSRLQNALDDGMAAVDRGELINGAEFIRSLIEHR